MKPVWGNTKDQHENNSDTCENRRFLLSRNNKLQVYEKKMNIFGHKSKESLEFWR